MHRSNNSRSNIITTMQLLILTFLTLLFIQSSSHIDASSIPPPDTPFAPPSLPSYTFHTVTHRFLVGFHAYADAGEHERWLRDVWEREVLSRKEMEAKEEAEMESIEPYEMHQCTAASQTHTNSSTQCGLYASPTPSSSLSSPLTFTIVQRHNPGSHLPTDFLLLDFSTLSSLTHPLSQSESPTRDMIKAKLDEVKEKYKERVKYIMEEKRVVRHLMNVVEEEEKMEETKQQQQEEQMLEDLLTRIPSRAKTSADDAEIDDDEVDSSPESSTLGDFAPPQRFNRAPDMTSNDSSLNITPSSGSSARRRLCQWSSNGGNSPTDLLKASTLWSRGHTGAGIRIAIFDTGLAATHPHFAHIDERTNWTNEPNLDDVLGHGTFVAGVIASQKDCLGFAPQASLFIFRVFNSNQLSFTSWFLDAFNYAIHTRVHVLNLSIGGPDFLDRPFVEKVNEMSANGIIVVSAIGNDGPLWGTLNNPADQMDVIGVGGINEDQRISSFSSRGMTTAELPAGYGRMKPDLVALARNIRGSDFQHPGSCKTMSGTSVASPVVAGCVALLASAVPVADRPLKLNPAYMKQLLLESSHRVNDGGIFEQGEGAINLEAAFELLQSGTFNLHASVIPSKLDLTDCPYMWPYCTQPIFYSGMPIILNLTVLNSQSVASFIPPPSSLQGANEPPQPHFHAADAESNKLHIRFTYPESFWPWSGWFGIHISLKEEVEKETVLQGIVEFTLQTEDDSAIREVIRLPIKLNAIPSPPREKRLLFDIFHNLRYPSGYFPRDNLDVRTDTLDWNGDHLHTNYRELYTTLRKEGYYIDILGRDYTCFDSSFYSTLLIIDPEEEYFVEEISKLQDDFYLNGLNIFIMAEWYNTKVMKEIKFYDENTAEWWTPETGGANIPALNTLLAGFGVELTDHVVKGEISIGKGGKKEDGSVNDGDSLHYSSGTTIGKWPASGSLGLHHLVDGGSGASTRDYAIYGIYDPSSSQYGSELAKEYQSSGRLFVYGDSNCIDMNHRQGSLCDRFVIDVLKLLNTGDRTKLFPPSPTYSPLPTAYVDTTIHKHPRRALGNNLIKYSKVTSSGSAPQCPLLTAPQAKTRGEMEEVLHVGIYEQIHAALATSTSDTSESASKPSRFNSAFQKLLPRKSKERKSPVEADDSLVREEEDGVEPAAARGGDGGGGGGDESYSNYDISDVIPLGSQSQSKSANLQPVLAKQARLNPSLGEDEEESQQRKIAHETEQLFASSSNYRGGSSNAQSSPRQLWLRIGLFSVIICILLVAYLYRNALRQQLRQQNILSGSSSSSSAGGKQSPQQTPLIPSSRNQPKMMMI